LVETPSGKKYALKILFKKEKPDVKRDFKKEVETLIILTSFEIEHGLLINGELLTPKLEAYDLEAEYPYFIMTLAEGITLSQLVQKGNVNLETLLTIFSQYSRVLVALHEGVRKNNSDLQPRNIFWNEYEGRIIVIDWDLLGPLNPPADTFQAAAYLFHSIVLAFSPTDDELKNIGERLIYESKEKGKVSDDEKINSINRLPIDEYTKTILKKGLTRKYNTARELMSDLDSALKNS